MKALTCLPGAAQPIPGSKRLVALAGLIGALLVWGAGIGGAASLGQVTKFTTGLSGSTVMRSAGRDGNIWGTSAAPAGTVKINAPGSPLHMSVGLGSIWVADHRGGFVYRINPKTNRTVAINVGNALCSPAVFGGGAVWIGGCESGPSYKIDPKSNRVVGQENGVVPVFGAGSLWMLDVVNNRIDRIDPRTGIVLTRIDPKIDLGANGGPVGYGFGSIWVASDTAVARINVNTNKVTSVVPLPGAETSGDYPGGYSYGGLGTFSRGEIWVTNPAGIYIVNPASHTATRLPLKIHPMSAFGDIYIVATPNGVWVRTGNTSIARLNPTTGRVVARYPATGGGGGLAVAFGSLWVANAGNDTIWREPLT